MEDLDKKEIIEDSDTWNGFMDKYPILFQQKSMSMTKTCMCWGIECPSGWKKLLTDLCDDLEKVNNLIGSKLGFEVQAEQVKEKLGTLRFYFNVYPKNGPETESEKYADEYNDLINLIDDIVEALIIRAEDQSYNTCQVCGKYLDDSTRVMSSGWIGYYCQDCAKKKNIVQFDKAKFTSGK